MKSKFLTVVAAGAALLTACKDDTAVFQGGTPGAATSLQITQAAFTFRQGDTSSIGGQLTDSAGNLVAGAATIASCDATVATVTAGTAPANSAGLAAITAVGIGHTCITYTAGGFVDTALVDVGPYALSIVGPASVVSGIGGASDRTGGKPSVYKVIATDPSGNVIPTTTPWFRTWTTQTDQTLLTPVSKNGVVDSVLIFSPGKTGNIRVAVQALGGATAYLPVSVIDGSFTGTLTVNNALTQPGLDTIIIARNSAGSSASTSPLWNATAGNITYTIGGVQTFARFTSVNQGGSNPQTYPTTPTNTSTQNAVIVIPPTGVSGALTLRMQNLGTANVTQSTSVAGGNQFTMNNTTGKDANDPADRTNAAPPNFTIPACNTTLNNVCGGGLAANGTFTPVTFNPSPIGINYSIAYGPCTAGTGTPNVVGGKAPSTGAAGSKCDVWLQLTNGLATVRSVAVNLAWFSNGDIDLYVYQADGVTEIAQANTSGNGVVTETVGFNMQPNQVVKVRANLQNQGSSASASAPIITGGIGATSRATLFRWQLTVNNN